MKAKLQVAKGRRDSKGNLMRSIWERQKITKRIKIGWRERSKKSQGGSGWNGRKRRNK